MQILLSNCVIIKNASRGIIDFCEQNFYIVNPEYTKKERLNIWLGNTPERLELFEVHAGDVILPIGLFGLVKHLIHHDDLQGCEVDVADKATADFNGINISLYDYQDKAVSEMLKCGYGILHSKAGSGKTRMGLAMITKLGFKALWLTHTHDLLNQAYESAAEFIPRERLGKIAEGKVHLNDITFATVQTMYRLDLQAYKYKFNVIIVDECHRVAGTPTAMNMFAKVLNNLAARHKFGLSATVHRADNLEKCIVAYLGQIKYSVPDEAVKNKVLPVTVKAAYSGIELDPDLYTDTSSMMIWAQYVSSLAYDIERIKYITKIIAKSLMEGRSVLVLSDRIKQLAMLNEFLAGGLLIGSVKAKDRKAIIDRARRGELKLVYATYSLAKEGLDIPALDTLIMATPVKDYAVVIQAAGRIARTADGKQEPVVYDIIDNDKKSESLFKKRCTHYRKVGYKICR